MKLRLLATTIALLAVAPGIAHGATIKVTTLNEGFVADGECGLREAVEASRLNKKERGCPKGETKRDTIKLKAADYQLGFTTGNENLNVNGDLDFTGGGPVTVLGQGKGETEILQNATDRVVDVREAGNVTLSKLRLGAGDVSTLGASEGRGGNARVEGGKLTVSKSDVSSSDAYVGGGIYAAGSAKLKLQNSQMSGTDAVAGGAIAVQTGATATLKRTTISTSGVDSATESVRGGIISNDGGDLVKVIESTLQGSSATTSGASDSALGAGIYTNGDLTVTRSLIQGNGTSADDDNTAEHGGGIHVASGAVKVVNTTLFNNRAGELSDNDGLGGGIYAGTGTLSIEHTTFDSNLGSSAGDAIAQVSTAVTLFGSLLDDEDDPCYGTVASEGFNVSEELDAQDDCGFVDSDARDLSTGALDVDDNGGPTETIAITAASPAVDRVPKGACKEATGKVDQRGYKRPAGDRCDSGAFELGAKKP